MNQPATLKKEDWMTLPGSVVFAIAEDFPDGHHLKGTVIICAIGDRWCVVTTDWYNPHTNYSM